MVMALISTSNSFQWTNLSLQFPLTFLGEHFSDFIRLLTCLYFQHYYFNRFSWYNCENTQTIEMKMLIELSMWAFSGAQCKFSEFTLASMNIIFRSPFEKRNNFHDFRDYLSSGGLLFVGINRATIRQIGMKILLPYNIANGLDYNSIAISCIFLHQ